MQSQLAVKLKPKIEELIKDPVSLSLIVRHCLRNNIKMIRPFEVWERNPTINNLFFIDKDTWNFDTDEHIGILAKEVIEYIHYTKRIDLSITDFDITEYVFVNVICIQVYVPEDVQKLWPSNTSMSCKTQ